MIWFDNSVEWQFWTGVFVIELTFLLLKPTSTPAKPVRFVNWSKEDSTQVTRYSKKNKLCLQTKFIMECNYKLSQSGRDCLCLVKASIKFNSLVILQLPLIHLIVDCVDDELVANWCQCCFQPSAYLYLQLFTKSRRGLKGYPNRDAQWQWK